jgi:hypothetical protein
MASPFDRLDFDFPESKFGDSIYLTDPVKKYLNAAPYVIPDWQQDDIGNGVVSRSRYYKNPQDAVCTQITANTTLLGTSANVPDPANTFIYAANVIGSLVTACASLIIEVAAFKWHTDNLSGLNATTDGNLTAPNYDLATGIGQQVLKITNATDEVANAVPVLGNFTSLFINSELTANNQTIHNDYILLESYYHPNGNNTISASEVNAMVSDVQAVTSLINTRRLADFTFYQQSRAIVEDYMFLTRFNNIGNTQNYLIQNLIGTDTLKQNLANN